MAKRVIFVLLGALGCFGQTVARLPSTGELPRIVWPKSAVTVVYAPDLAQAGQAGKSDRPGLDTWIRNPTPSAVAKDKANPIEFAAPKGAVGIRVGAESTIGTTAVIGDDGKRHVECAPLPQAMGRLKPAGSTGVFARSGSDN
jgi:hypothetical protein